MPDEINPMMKELMDLIDELEMSKAQIDKLKPIVKAINSKLEQEQLKPTSKVYVVHAWGREWGSHIYGVFITPEEAIAKREKVNANISTHTLGEITDWLLDI